MVHSSPWATRVSRASRAGKYFQIEVESASEHEAAESVEGMCKQLLANPVIEQYEFKLTSSGNG